MNEQRGDCYYHPEEIVIGVCPLCLYERLLVLAAKQAAGHTKKGSRISTTFANKKSATTTTYKTPAAVLPKIFAFGSLLNRFEFRHHHHHRKSDTCSSTPSQDDSFISIQFENNGAGSWEKSRVSKVTVDHCNKPWKNTSNNKNSNTNNKNLISKGENKGGKTVIEHVKPRGSSLRWRKRIGHVFQVMRWKRSNKGNVCHVNVGSKMEGVKVRNGWITTLTKRRSNKE